MKSILSTLCFLVLSLFLHAQSGLTVKIPIEGSRWYQLNYTSGSLSNLFDGNKDTKAVSGWSNMLQNYDAYYPLQEGELMTIDSIRMYDKENVFISTPLKLYAVTENWERKLIATFTGETYNQWVGPYPSRPFVFKLDTPVTNVRYLMMNIYLHAFPGEIELYGKYTPPAAAPAVARPQRVPLKNMTGVNGFPWDFMQPYNARFIQEEKMNAITSFSGFRMYIDWEKLEEVEGRYTLSPLARGGWHLDTIFQRCQQAGIEMLPVIQNIPPWMVATYPDSLKASDNNPVRYGKSFSDPASYTEQARVGFQFAARFGSNLSVDPSLVSVYSVPQWYMQPVNEKKIGLNLIKYIECGNEQDKWWKGRKGYLTGREYAANLSAFYDGHKNTLGPGVGVKNADPNMKVVMCGVASATPDYFRGIVDWCREFRGYKADGSVDLCFDVINYHLYSNDAGSSQSGGASRGAAPERSNCAAVARNFVNAAAQYAYGMPVWITEQGYDLNQGSVQKAIPIGNKTALETQADWTLRSALLYAREGLQKGFFYETYDYYPDIYFTFASSGLINKENHSRKPAADFLLQTTKLFGEYVFQETLNSDPIVDRYTSNGKTMYALVVPDEKGRTAAYELDLGTADSAFVYMPVIGGADMQVERVATTAGKLVLTVTETPVFVVPSGATAPAYSNIQSALQYRRLSEDAQAKQSLGNDIALAPNPVTSKLLVKNKNGHHLKLVLTDMQGHKIYESVLTGQNGVVPVHQLAAGMYLLSFQNMETNERGSKWFVKE